MTLNISEIKNQKAKAIAYQVDDGDGKLNQKEFIDFKNIAKNVLNAKVFNKTCSLFKPEGAEAAKVESQNVDTVEVQENTQAPTQVKHGIVQREKNITNIQNTLIKCMNENKGLILSQVMEELREDHIGRTCAQELNEIKNIIKTIASMGIKDKDGVESIRKNLRKTDGINTYAYRNIITLLEQVKENEVVQAEANLIKCIYGRITKENPAVTNIEERFELVEKELEEAKLKDTSYFSGKAMKIAKDYAVSLAKEGIKIDNYEDREYLDADAKQKAAKDAAKGDKYTKKAVKESTTSYEVYANWNKYEQRGETIDKITEAELDGLSKGLREKLFDKFIPADAQEPYNFEEIYKIIGKRMGNDATVMHTDKNSREMDEYKNISDDLGALGKALSEKELKELIEFCGGTCAKKDRSIETASKEGLKNMGLGALVGLLNGLAIDLEQTMLINIDSSLANELKKDLEKGGHKVQTTAGKGEGKVGIILNQELLADTHAVTTIAGAIEGFAAGFLATVIFGKERLEGDCVSLSDFTINDSKYTNYEEYKKYITEKHPAVKANALLAIVEEFKKEDGTIDVAGYNSYLNEIAGIGSKLNCLELEYAGRGKKVETTTETTDDGEDEVKDKLNIEQVHYEKPTPTKEKVEIKTENLAHSSWPKIADSYDCLDEQFGSKYNAIRVIKIAQGIENEELFTNEAVLQHLLELSLDHKWSEMKQIPGFNFDKFWGYYKGQVIGEVKLPSRLGNCSHKDIDYTDRSITDKSGKGPAGIPVETYRVGSKSEEDWGYRYKDENGVSHTVWCGTKDKQEKAIEDFVAANPNLEITIVENVYEVEEK